MSERSSLSSSWRTRDWRLGMRVRADNLTLGSFTPTRDTVLWYLRSNAHAPDGVLRLSEYVFKARIVYLQSSIVSLIGANMANLVRLIALKNGHIKEGMYLVAQGADDPQMEETQKPRESGLLVNGEPVFY